MKFTLSTIALVATLLAQETLAGVVAVHPRHAARHAAIRREASEVVEAARAPEIVAREVVYVTNTIHQTVTVFGGGAQVKAVAPTPAPQPDQGTINAANYEATKKARISVLQHEASVALENWSRTKDQQQTTLQKVAAPAAPSPKPEAPKPAPEAKPVAPAAPAPQAKAAVPAAPDTQGAVVVEQPKGVAPSRGKRGLVYNKPSLVTNYVGTSGKASWAYNWASDPTEGRNEAGLPGGIEYVPMLWGLRDDAKHSDIKNWVDHASKAIAAGSTHLLAFNEPDHHEQANIDPATCAAGYKKHMQPFAGKAKLGAPGVTNGGGAMGLNYLKSFMDLCDDCTIDFVPIHWYAGAGNFDYFKKHIEDANAVAGGRPLWITEFQADGSDSEQAEFLNKALPWLEAQDYVERYSYFMVDKVLLNSPTVGAAYLNAV